MPFKTLIIGTGFGSRVVKGCYEEAGMDVTVVSARDQDVVRAACAEPFHLISVHSPPFLQAQHVNWALDHGRDVLCDKPFGVSGDEARQMLDRAREVGVIHLLNFEFRQDPGRRRVKEILDSGAIGNVTHVNWMFFNAFARLPVRQHGWQFDEKMGGGWIRINGTHMFDALHWLLGEVVSLDVRTRIDTPQRPDSEGALHPSSAEDGFSALMTLDGGANVVLDTAWSVPGTLPDHWTIVGTTGMLDVTEKIEIYRDPMVRDTEIKLFTESGEQVEHAGPFAGDGHLPAMRPWSKMVREAISEHRQIEPSFAAGVAASDVVDRMHAALRDPVRV